MNMVFFPCQGRLPDGTVSDNASKLQKPVSLPFEESSNPWGCNRQVLTWSGTCKKQLERAPHGSAIWSIWSLTAGMTFPPCLVEIWWWCSDPGTLKGWRLRRTLRVTLDNHLGHLSHSPCFMHYPYVFLLFRRSHVHGVTFRNVTCTAWFSAVRLLRTGPKVLQYILQHPVGLGKVKCPGWMCIFIYAYIYICVCALYSFTCVYVCIYTYVCIFCILCIA